MKERKRRQGVTGILWSLEHRESKPATSSGGRPQGEETTSAQVGDSPGHSKVATKRTEPKVSKDVTASYSKARATSRVIRHQDAASIAAKMAARIDRITRAIGLVRYCQYAARTAGITRVMSRVILLPRLPPGPTTLSERWAQQDAANMPPGLPPGLPGLPDY